MKKILFGLLTIFSLTSLTSANAACCHENGYIKLSNEWSGCHELSGCGGRKIVSSISRILHLIPESVSAFESSCGIELDEKLLKQLRRLDRDYDRNNGNGSNVRVNGVPAC